jgi:uncharacterized protein (TIGR02001 family)
MRVLSKCPFAVLALLAGTTAFSQDKAPAPSFTFTGNVGVVSDYRFRGLTQTSYNGALQGGVDVAHKSGLYVGAWASNVKWIKDYVGATAGDTEVDLYGGYKHEIATDLTVDIGAIGYLYPDNTAAKVTTATYKNADTTEVYLGLTYKMVTFKYFYSTDNFLANANSTGARYFDLSATFDLGGGFSLTPHAGIQTIPNQTSATATANAGDYRDYSLTLGKDFGNGLAASAGFVNVVGADPTFYLGSGNNQMVSRPGWVFGLKYSF